MIHRYADSVNMNLVNPASSPTTAAAAAAAAGMVNRSGNLNSPPSDKLLGHIAHQVIGCLRSGGMVYSLIHWWLVRSVVG
jgi:hypothetical protein